MSTRLVGPEPGYRSTEKPWRSRHGADVDVVVGGWRYSHAHVCVCIYIYVRIYTAVGCRYIYLYTSTSTYIHPHPNPPLTPHSHPQPLHPQEALNPPPRIISCSVATPPPHPTLSHHLFYSARKRRVPRSLLCTALHCTAQRISDFRVCSVRFLEKSESAISSLSSF